MRFAPPWTIASLKQPSIISKSRFHTNVLFQVVWPNFPKNIPHSRNQDKSQTLLDIIRNVLQIFLIPSREQNRLNSSSMSRQNLLFNPSNWKHLSSQSKFSRHRNLRIHNSVGEQRD